MPGPATPFARATLTTSAVISPTLVPPDWLDLAGGVPLDVALSPNNKWLVRNTDGLRAIQFVSTADPTHTLDTLPDPELGEHLSPHAWAPDSSAFVAYGADLGYAGCPFRRVIIYTLAASDTVLNHVVFEPYDVEGCITLAWSPDSSRLATSLDGREIFVVNKQAQVLEKIVPELTDDSGLACCWWDQSGLFYLVVDNANPAQPVYELRKVDPTNPQKHLVVLNRSGWQLSIVGSAQNPPRLLILEKPTECGNDLVELWVLNLKTNQVEQKGVFHGSYCSSSSSPQSDSVALKIAEADQPCGGNTSLWMFNWSKNELADRGRIVSLIGWHTDIQGFVVIKGVYPNNLRLETIKP